MSRNPKSPTIPASPPGWADRLDSVIFTICLGLLALRVTLTEGPPMHTFMTGVTLQNPVISVCLSLIPIVLMGLWMLASLLRSNGRYRFTGMEIGLGLLILGSIIGYGVAADRRQALNDIVITAGPIVSALLLTQVLQSEFRRRLLLAVILGLCIAATAKGLDQLTYANQETIEQYQEDPNSFLVPLGVEQGTLKQFMFEHRLYSQGMQSFFTTRNSMAVFLLMSLFVGLLVVGQKRPDKRQWLMWILGLLLLVTLLLTQSKGALISLVLTLGAWGIWSRWGNRLQGHGGRITLALVVLALIGTWGLVHYGRTHGRLPGGNSMWVRWQYWSATAQLIGEHPWTGVGPGNFGYAYHQVKPAGALEAVSDPHNLILSLWARFGLIGLLGFACLVAGPWLRPTRDHEPSLPPNQQGFRLWFGPALALTLALLIARPCIAPPKLSSDLYVDLYIGFTQYLLPWGFTLLGLWILRHWIIATTPRSTLPIVCGLGAVLFANLTDFALFEPAVGTPFWGLWAVCLSTRGRTLTWSQWPKASKAVMALALVILMVWLPQQTLLPLSGAIQSIQQAYQAIEQGQVQVALGCLDKACTADPLNPDPWRIKGKVLQSYTGPHQDPLRKALTAYEQAEQRNDRDFRIAEDRGDTQARLGQWAEALESFNRAKALYPGCGRLWYKAARCADQLNQTSVAQENYAQTITIEEAFQDQFKQMYPHEKTPVSRLGWDKLSSAKQRLNTLENR